MTHNHATQKKQQEDSSSPVMLLSPVNLKWYQNRRVSLLFFALIIVQFIVTFALFTTMVSTHSHLLFLCGGAEFIVFCVLFIVSVVGVIVSLYSALTCCNDTAASSRDIAFNRLTEISRASLSTVLRSNEVEQSMKTELPSPNDNGDDDRYTTTPKSAREKLLSQVFLGVRLSVITLSVLSTLVIVVLSIVYLSITQSALPRYSGTFTIKHSKLSAPVTVHRERSGLIHVIGRKKLDVSFAQGFVSAQERLWQMEFNRRVARGRLSEVVGSAGLGVDKFMRTMGFARLVDEDVSNGIYKAEIIEIVQRFVDGVNAYIDSHAAAYRLAPEFGIFGYKPEPFSVADVILWTKLLSYDLSTNLDYELDRFYAMKQGISLQRVEELMAPSAIEQTILSKEELNITSTTAQDEDLERQFNDNSGAYIPAPFSNSRRVSTTKDQFNFGREYKSLYSKIFKHDHNNPFASNNWVVSGSLMENGKGFCANDPHLTISSPSIWILMHVKTTHEENNWDAMGATLPTIPNIIIGKNQDICWSVTNSMPDVQDLYVVDEVNGKYEYNGKMVNIVEREEAIKVKGASNVIYKVRSTLYGPIVNDIYPDELGEEKPVSLRWTSLQPNDTTAEVMITLLERHNWTDFRNSFARYVSPTQNFVYADASGNIGYLTPGLVPIREQGHSGMFPVPGNGTYDWRGYIPFDSLPQVYNPAKGYVVTANNRVQPAGYPYNFARDFSSIQRAARIVEMMEEFVNSTQPITVEDMKTIQLDVKSLLFNDIRDAFSKLNGHVSGEYEQWRNKLEKWDGIESVGSTQASVFEAFVYHSPNLFVKELGRKYYDNDLLVKTLKNVTDISLLQDVSTVFKTAVNSVSQTNGVKEWGKDVHAITANHAILGKSPIKCIANRWIYVPGGTGTVAVAPPKSNDLSVTHGASYRHLINFDENEDQFVIPGGQSGNMFSYYYDNMLFVYSKGGYFPMRTKGYPVYRTMKIN